MHVRNVNHVTPLVSDHGETVYETIGRSAGGTTSHSLAQIVLAPGCSSLKHYHPVAEESYHVLAGRGEMQIDTERRAIAAGDSVVITPGQVHTITNTGEDDLVFLAVCVPAWVPDNSVFVD